MPAVFVRVEATKSIAKIFAIFAAMLAAGFYPGLRAGCETGSSEEGRWAMSYVSLKLVHNRPFAASSDDLAAVLVFSAAGLIGQLFVLAMGLKSLIA